MYPPPHRRAQGGEANAHGDVLKHALATGLFAVAETSMGVGGSCRGEDK